MEFAVLGWPPDGPTLDLDHEQFAYAGKFVMSETGKAVAREGSEDEALIAAVAFSPDRTDAETLRLRYVTVREDRRGEGIGPRLLRFVTERALDQTFDREFETVVIAVNNPYAYEAAYRAGFGYTGESTGIAELELVAPPADRSDAGRYAAGLAEIADRDLPAPVASFVSRTRQTGPPAVVEGEPPAENSDR